jgi:hypothetical protein
MRPRSRVTVLGEAAHLLLKLCLGDRAPYGLVDFFTGAFERKHD